MNNPLQQIINAVLFEGYILHPYRAPSPENPGERFALGRIYPEIYSQRQNGGELCQMQTEVLLETGNDLPELHITLGFLQPIQREIGSLPRPLQALPQNEELELNGKTYQAWLEAVERQVTVPLKTFQGSVEAFFNFEAECLVDPIFDEHGCIVAAIRTRQSPICGKVIVKSQVLKNGLSKVSVTVLNQSMVEEAQRNIPEKILAGTFASAHVILRAKHAQFISLWEPPVELKYFAVQCQNIGLWPVLTRDGSKDEGPVMLASPIMLYDHPQIFPEDKTDVAGETVMAEIRANDLPPQLAQEESAARLRGVGHEIYFSNDEFDNPNRPVKTVLVAGVELSAGDKVLIRPAHQADAIDTILAGRTAVIETLEQDATGQIHLALVLDEDPGVGLRITRESGHRFFYRADEVEPCKLEVAS